MLHVLLKHPYSNSLSNRLLRRKSVSCKNIRWPETKCILVYDEKMPLSPWKLSSQHLKCIGKKDCNKEIHVMSLVWEILQLIYMVTFCLMPLDPFSFCLFSWWSLMFCAHTHTYEKSLQRSPLLHADQYISKHFSVLSKDTGSFFLPYPREKSHC